MGFCIYSAQAHRSSLEVDIYFIIDDATPSSPARGLDHAPTLQRRPVSNHALIQPNPIQSSKQAQSPTMTRAARARPPPVSLVLLLGLLASAGASIRPVVSPLCRPPPLFIVGPCRAGGVVGAAGVGGRWGQTRLGARNRKVSDFRFGGGGGLVHTMTKWRQPLLSCASTRTHSCPMTRASCSSC